MKLGATIRVLGLAVFMMSAVHVPGFVYPQQPAGTPHKQDSAAPASSQSAQKKMPSAAADNPFPEDQSRQGAEPNASPAATPGVQAAPPGQPSTPQNSTAQDNPFPEDVSRKAAEGANHPVPAQPSGVSSSASSYPDLEPERDRHRLPKPSKDVAPGSLSGVARANQDVQVGTYYLSSGDWTGAYGRFREASQDDPTNPDAIFGLAEAARHLGHSDEAVANYKLYLAILPDGPKAKSARKGLETVAAKK